MITCWNFSPLLIDATKHLSFHQMLQASLIFFVPSSKRYITTHGLTVNTPTTRGKCKNIYKNTTHANKRNNQNSKSKTQDNYMNQVDTNDRTTSSIKKTDVKLGAPKG